MVFTTKTTAATTATTATTAATIIKWKESKDFAEPTLKYVFDLISKKILGQDWSEACGQICVKIIYKNGPKGQQMSKKATKAKLSYF